jgi:hypothetical protein
VPDSWGKKYVKNGLANSILNRTPLTAETNRNVIGSRLPNAYLLELVKQSGEPTVRGILETHFISKVAFDILLRDPFTVEDFEEFLAERQRTFQDAIENLLIKERLDLPPQLRELDAAIEHVELALRSCVQVGLKNDPTSIPPHIVQKVDERISRAIKKNAAIDADRLKSLAGMLEFFDLRELQDTIVSKANWAGASFERYFGSKEALSTKVDQMAELRNSIRHSRAVGEVVRKEGEAALIWFGQVLKKVAPEAAEAG